MCLLSAPLKLFPMYVIEKNILIDHLNCDPSILPGIRGNALYFDGLPGSRVDNGVHAEGCFFNPHQCDQGITLSIWLVLHESLSRFQIITDNGGCNPYGIGFCIYMYGSGFVDFVVKNKIKYLKSVFQNLQSFTGIYLPLHLQRMNLLCLSMVAIANHTAPN